MLEHQGLFNLRGELRHILSRETTIEHIGNVVAVAVEAYLIYIGVVAFARNAGLTNRNLGGITYIKHIRRCWVVCRTCFVKTLQISPYSCIGATNLIGVGRYDLETLLGLPSNERLQCFLEHTVGNDGVSYRIVHFGIAGSLVVPNLAVQCLESRRILAVLDGCATLVGIAERKGNRNVVADGKRIVGNVVCKRAYNDLYQTDATHNACFLDCNHFRRIQTAFSIDFVLLERNIFLLLVLEQRRLARYNHLLETCIGKTNNLFGVNRNIGNDFGAHRYFNHLYHYRQLWVANLVVCDIAVDGNLGVYFSVFDCACQRNFRQLACKTQSRTGVFDDFGGVLSAVDCNWNQCLCEACSTDGKSNNHR